MCQITEFLNVTRVKTRKLDKMRLLRMSEFEAKENYKYICVENFFVGFDAKNGISVC